MQNPMTPDTKKLICDTAGVDISILEYAVDDKVNELIWKAVLQDAVFAINRGDGMYQINLVFEHFNVYVDGNVRHFFYKDHNGEMQR
jgi:hypothetical protein